MFDGRGKMGCMAPPRTYPKTVEALPEWLRELPGADMWLPMLRDREPPGAQGDWRVEVTVPDDLAALVEVSDPLVVLVSLAFAAARIEDKMVDVVAVCRQAGKPWTKIGEALGMTKQAAWERFSGED
jgi:hypothetical protein